MLAVKGAHENAHENAHESGAPRRVHVVWHPGGVQSMLPHGEAFVEGGVVSLGEE